jgi:hypothetical protein
MANCKFTVSDGIGEERKFTCTEVATTTLKKHDGEIVQLCEAHAAMLIRLAKDCEADHWLVINKIPS